MNAHSGQTISPFPGILVLEEYTLQNKKLGGYHVPQEDKENAPQIGKILSVGEIPVEVAGKLSEWYKGKDYDKAIASYAPFKVGMIVAYKKYQDFPIKIGTKEFKGVLFENVLFEIKEGK